MPGEIADMDLLTILMMLIMLTMLTMRVAGRGGALEVSETARPCSSLSPCHLRWELPWPGSSLRPREDGQSGDDGKAVVETKIMMTIKTVL